MEIPPTVPNGGSGSTAVGIYAVGFVIKGLWTFEVISGLPPPDFLGGPFWFRNRLIILWGYFCRMVIFDRKGHFRSKRGHLGSNGIKFPAVDTQDHLRALFKRGGAIFPKDVDLEQLLAKKSKMGDGAPKVRVVVGKNYGQNADGTPKPIRAMLEEWILKFECPTFYFCVFKILN